MQFFDKKFGYPTSENPFTDELITNAKRLGGTPGKGILATDESNYTIGLRFDSIGVPTEKQN